MNALRQAVQRRVLALGNAGGGSFLPGGLFGALDSMQSERSPARKYRIGSTQAVQTGPVLGSPGRWHINTIVEGTHFRVLEIQSRSHVEVLHNVEGQVRDGKDGKHDDNQVDRLLPKWCVVHVVAYEGFDDAARSS